MRRRGSTYEDDARGTSSLNPINDVLPSNLDAERSVLGAMLVSPVAALYGAEHLTSEQFYRDAHRKVFASMQALVERKQEVDFVTVRNELALLGHTDDVGGPAYISSLADGVPKSTNIPYYAGIVADLALRREVIYTASKILQDAYGWEKDARSLVRRADDAFLAIDTGRQGSSELIAPDQAVRELTQDLERRISSGGALSGVDTGLTPLNELTNGWQGGDLIVLAARTSMGKTALALNTAVAAARSGVSVAFFSLEMTRQQVEYRLLSMLSGVMMFRILKGFLGKADYEKIAAAMEVRHSLPIYVDDTPKIPIGEIRSKARRQKATKGCGMVVADYIQLITSGGRRKELSRTEEIGEITGKLKGLAKELSVPVIGLAQISRAPDGRADSRPKLSDLRESGSIEMDADLGVIIHRKDHKESGATDIMLEKQRNGPTGLFIVDFNRETQVFSDVTSDTENQSEPRAQSTRATKGRVPSATT